MAKILIVDEEAQIRRFMRIGLTANGYAVAEADSGTQGIAACAAQAPDLVILDLGLPDRDGQEVISAIRERSQVPIIVLSVRSAETDKVEALDRGADDYVVKPFAIGELMARVRANLRQRAGNDQPPVIRTGDLHLDFGRRVIEKGGQEIHLSRKEYELLQELARHADHVLTHGQILRAVWGKGHTEDTAYLRVYINQLRQKLETEPSRPRLILTEPGVGYRLRIGEDP